MSDADVDNIRARLIDLAVNVELSNKLLQQLSPEVKDVRDMLAQATAEVDRVSGDVERVSELLQAPGGLAIRLNNLESSQNVLTSRFDSLHLLVTELDETVTEFLADSRTRSMVIKYGSALLAIIGWLLTFSLTAYEFLR